MIHDPALCKLEACQMCDVYGDGWTAGKHKALEDVRNLVEDGGHDVRCGCEPCKLIRLVRGEVVGC